MRADKVVIGFNSLLACYEALTFKAVLLEICWHTHFGIRVPVKCFNTPVWLTTKNIICVYGVCVCGFVSLSSNHHVRNWPPPCKRTQTNMVTLYGSFLQGGQGTATKTRGQENERCGRGAIWWTLLFKNMKSPQITVCKVLNTTDLNLILWWSQKMPIWMIILIFKYGQQWWFLHGFILSPLQLLSCLVPPIGPTRKHQLILKDSQSCSVHVNDFFLNLFHPVMPVEVSFPREVGGDWSRPRTRWITSPSATCWCFFFSSTLFRIDNTSVFSVKQQGVFLQRKHYSSHEHFG